MMTPHQLHLLDLATVAPPSSLTSRATCEAVRAILAEREELLAGIASTHKLIADRSTDPRARDALASILARANGGP